MAARSSERSRTSRKGGGTSPAAMRSARPSTSAVLPTPASPTTIGLFCRRRIRMSTTSRISRSRPCTGSMLPALACAVRSVVNLSSAVSPRFGDAGSGATPAAAVAGSSAATESASSDEPRVSSPKRWTIAVASRARNAPDASARSRRSSGASSMPCRRCAVRMRALPKTRLALIQPRSMASSRSRLKSRREERARRRPSSARCTPATSSSRPTPSRSSTSGTSHPSVRIHIASQWIGSM